MKKTIPLELLKILQPIVDDIDNQKIVEVIKDTNTLFHIKDKDEKSDFFFKVTKQGVSNGRGVYYVESKPIQEKSVSAQTRLITPETLADACTKWIGLVHSYNIIHTVYDDPILKSNQERFEKDYALIDEDADTSSFELKKQLFLNEYLNNVKAKLLTLQEGRPENEKMDIEEIIKDADETQKNLTKETKRQIFKRLTRIWAKAQKVGLDVLKEIFVGVTTEITKQLILGQ